MLVAQLELADDGHAAHAYFAEHWVVPWHAGADDGEIKRTCWRFRDTEFHLRPARSEQSSVALQLWRIRRVHYMHFRPASQQKVSGGQPTLADAEDEDVLVFKRDHGGVKRKP